MRNWHWLAGLLVLFAGGALAVGAVEPMAPSSRFAPVTQSLERLINRELRDKQIPALSIALVDDQRIVWSRGFGLQHPKRKTAATAETVYRVGSVSKLFTDIAIMRLVERGALSLDAPVTQVLPEFVPRNPFAKPITLRQLMSHRSGLVREPPVGSYFDAASPSLAETVASLNRTELVYAPASRTKYSNAGIAVVGHALERVQRQPFAQVLRREVLEPLGMPNSGFAPTRALRRNLASALMWTYDGRTFDAPTFELGMAPAGCMYSTVNDLGVFLSMLFARGRGAGGELIKPETLEQMWTPQFAPAGTRTGFGLGFNLTEFEARRRVGHNGAIYGFATTLAAMPDDKLGVVVAASKDVANAVTDHIANTALRLMLAQRQDLPLPALEETTPIPREVARRLAGHYERDGRSVELTESNGRLVLRELRGGFRTELRAKSNSFMVDDVHARGTPVSLVGELLTFGASTFLRVPQPKPAPPPSRWDGLIGEYGWDHNVLYVFEQAGKLQALIEWIEFDPLEEVSENVFKFPEVGGMYHGERLLFTRDFSGRATQVAAAGIVFPRRALAGESGETFRIQPQRPVEELLRAALRGRPPQERGEFHAPDLVEVVSLDATIKLDIRYATANNFLSTPFYTSARAFLQRPAAEAVARANRALRAHGYGLLIHDGYRPWYVTKTFWDATPPPGRIFVADPSKGSRHNRGCAVDLTLYELATSRVVQMPGGYDEMSDRSYPDYPGGTSLQRWQRDLLRRAMEAEGFAVYETEWWHFDFQGWQQWPLLNQRFEELNSN